MLKPFEELGKLVATRWEQANHSFAAFSDIATESLLQSRVLESVEHFEIVRWLMRAPEIPEQMISDFGQPPVNLYIGDRFRIEALYWIDSSTSIHEHSFAGAFGVLCGGSVHSTYQFTPESEITSRFVVGRTKFLKSELLQRGNVRTIWPEDKLIHCLFHLERPSVSIVVRTSKKLQQRPQYDHLPPYLAIDPFEIPKRQTIQLRMLNSLLSSDLPLFWRAAKEIVAESTDPWLIHQVLSIAYRKSDDHSSWMDLLQEVNPWRSDLLQYMIPCLREESRGLRISLLRSSVHDATHRFFLALLLNVPTRDELIRLIVERFPAEDAETLVVRWLGEIFVESRMGIKLTSSSLFLLSLMLRDPDFDYSRNELKKSFGPEHFDEGKLREVWDRIRSVDIFKTLLGDDQLAAMKLAV